MSQTMRNASTAVDGTAVDPLPNLSDQKLYTAWTAKGATRTTSEKPERPYKVEYANMKEQSGNERPLLLSGCIQLKLVTTSTLKEKT